MAHVSGRPRAGRALDSASRGPPEFQRSCRPNGRSPNCGKGGCMHVLRRTFATLLLLGPAVASADVFLRIPIVTQVEGVVFYRTSVTLGNATSGNSPNILLKLTYRSPVDGTLQNVTLDSGQLLPYRTNFFEDIIQHLKDSGSFVPRTRTPASSAPCSSRSTRTAKRSTSASPRRGRTAPPPAAGRTGSPTSAETARRPGRRSSRPRCATARSEPTGRPAPTSDS